MSSELHSPLKICGRCKIEKPIVMFNKDKTNSDGLHGNCKACRRNTQLKHKAKRYIKGKCVCGNDLEPDRKACRACLDRRRRRYYDFKARGLCSCGRPTTDNKIYCRRCRKIEYAKRIEKRIVQKALGLCICGRPVIKGLLSCLRCRERDRSYQRRKHG